MSPYDVGDLAAKYETGNKGPGFISDGSSWGDPGGDSYGSYQLETKLGTMQGYLKGSDMFIDELKKFKINSPQFKLAWQEMARVHPIEFQQSQFDYLAKKTNGYNAALDYAKNLRWMTDSFALQSAIFSTSNQSGGWKKIFNKTNINPIDDEATQINKLYDARAVYFNSLSSLSPTIKKNIIRTRTVQERKDCLALINHQSIVATTLKQNDYTRDVMNSDANAAIDGVIVAIVNWIKRLLGN